jgi:hypothetical protein
MDVDLEKQVKLACVSAALVNNISKHLYGELMAICECSFSNEIQQKAVKSLVSQSFTRNVRRVLEDLNQVGG